MVTGSFDGLVVPGGRIGPDKLRARPPVVALVSDNARFVTGVNLPIDGGLSTSNGQPALS